MNYIFRNIKKMEELEDIQEIIRLNCPVSVKAGMLGMYLRSDILVSGADNTFFKDTKLKWRDFKLKDSPSEDSLPVVVPLFIMDIYNNFAASNGLPGLGPKALNLLSIEILFGKSSFMRNNNKEFKYKAKVFGFTETITSAGIIVPAGFIRDFCRDNYSDLQLTDKCWSCIMLIAKAKDAGSIPGIAKKIRSMNLNVESQADIAARTGKALLLLNITFSIIVGVVLLLTLIAIFNSYLAIVYTRSYAFSLQRMLGASKMRIILIFVLESGIIGVLYGFLGNISGYYICNYLSDNISVWIPLLQGFNFRISPFQYLSAAVAFSVLVSIGSAIIPAFFASNLNLFKAIKK